MSKGVVLRGLPTHMPSLQEACGLSRSAPLVAELRGRIDEDRQVDEINELWSRRVCAVEDDDGRRVPFREISAHRVRPVGTNAGLEIQGSPPCGDAGEQRLERFAPQTAPVDGAAGAVARASRVPLRVGDLCGDRRQKVGSADRRGRRPEARPRRTTRTPCLGSPDSASRAPLKAHASRVSCHIIRSRSVAVRGAGASFPAAAIRCTRIVRSLTSLE